MNWKFLVPGLDEFDASSLGKRMIDVFCDGFGIPQEKSRWSATDAANMVRRSTVAGFLADGDPSTSALSGYACYVCPVACVNASRHLLWEDGICVRKGVQEGTPKRRWGVEATDGATAEVARLGRTVGYVGGRTQNPSVFKRYSMYSESRKLFPLDEPYWNRQGRELMSFLIANIKEVTESYSEGAKAGREGAEAVFDPRIGLFQGCYKEGRLGDYRIPADDETNEREACVKALGFNRDRGDAVVVVARFKEAR